MPTATRQKLRPTDIRDDVLAVLRSARKGTDQQPGFLTAYQILNRLEKPLRTQLIAEHRVGGRGTGRAYAATKVVSRAAELLHPQVEWEFLDVGGMGIEVEIAGERRSPSSKQTIAIYRYRP